MVRDKTITKMIKQDEDRARSGEELTNHDELLGLARTGDSRVLKSEAEMRAAGVKPIPRRGASESEPPRPHVPRASALRSTKLPSCDMGARSYMDRQETPFERASCIM